MEKWIGFLQMHGGILTGVALIVLGIVLAFILSRVLNQIKRLNRSLSSITKNVQAYFDVIMQEEPEVQEESQESGRRPQEALQGRYAEREESSVERELREQEEEEVFNAVLQEYFS